MTMKLLAADARIIVPKEVATCPYCDTTLTASFEAWAEEDDGTYKATKVTLDCETEPEIGTDEWEEWFARHSDMPYVYLLPVEAIVEEWIGERYRFEL